MLRCDILILFCHFRLIVYGLSVFLMVLLGLCVSAIYKKYDLVLIIC
jgi:hypothetical protein